MIIIKKVFSTSIVILITFYVYSYISKESINKDLLIKRITNYSLSPHIIKRCQKDYNYTDDDMIILERELKRYFTLAAINRHGSGIGMYSKDVDNLWHTFILFTKDYAHFCKNHISHFLHHIPKTDVDKATENKVQAQHNFQQFIKNYESIFHEQIHPVWFLDMCKEDILFSEN